MKTLQVDEKWSVEYDPGDNDRPKRLFRYGEEVTTPLWTNITTAFFYALLDAKEQQ